MLDALGRYHEIEALAPKVRGELQGIGDFRRAADALSRSLDEARSKVARGNERAAGVQALAEVSEAATHVERLLADDDLVAQEVVDQRLDASARVVLRKRGLEFRTETLVDVFFSGWLAHNRSSRREVRASFVADI